MSRHLQAVAMGALALMAALSGFGGEGPDERTDEAPAPSGTSSTEAAVLPSQVLDLESWKLTLPRDDPATGRAAQVEQPALAQHQSRYVRVVDGGVELVVPAGAPGPRTRGTRAASCGR